MTNGHDEGGAGRSRRAVSPATALACLAIALMAVPAVIGIRSLSRPDAPPPPRTPIRVVGEPRRLGAEAERGGAATPKIPISGHAELSLLALVPERPGPVRRDAEILDGAGRSAWRQEGVVSLDRAGSYLVVVEPRTLRPGSYTLRFTDVEALTGSPLGSATFSFELVGGSAP